MPWANLLPTKTVILPYASPPIKPISKVTLKTSKGSSTYNLTFQVIDTDQPALLSIEASKALGVLTLNAYFVRKCFTNNAPLPLMSSPLANQESAAGPPPPAPNTSSRTWPEPGALTMEFISKNCTSIFQGLGFRLRPAAPPQTIPLRSPPLPYVQPSLPAAPPPSSSFAPHELNQPPTAASPLGP